MPNADNVILPGGYARVSFTEAHGDLALTLPSNTLIFRPEGPSVGVVKSDGEVELRVVALGRDQGATVEIVSGVGPQDRLVLNPADSLTTGARVRVAELGKPAGVLTQP